MTGWAAFWLFMALYLAIDTGLFLKGYNTLFWTYHTPNELEKQRQIFGLDQRQE